MCVGRLLRKRLYYGEKLLYDIFFLLPALFLYSTISISDDDVIKLSESRMNHNQPEAPVMFVKKYFEEFALNDTRVTKRRTVTEADIEIHAEQSGDFFPHHMDEKWCKTQPFKKRIAHGTMIFSIGIGPVSYTHLRAHETPEHLV